MHRRKFFHATVATLTSTVALGKVLTKGEKQSFSKRSPIKLSASHIKAVNRRRRVVKNFDVLLVDPDKYSSIHEIIRDRFSFIDDPSSCIDSVWWNWGEGNVVPYPSKFLPTYNQPAFQRWIQEGTDIVKIFQDETSKRGLEVFFSHRMNGSDNDPQFIPGRGTFIDDMDRLNPVPLKQKHPEWLISVPWHDNGFWNYAVKGVRDYVLRKMEEIASDYDFDGIELDFARMGIVLPPGQAWENRALLTELIRNIRIMTLEKEQQRGRPFLIAVRVPENLVGCQFEGMDVATWLQEQLIDIIVLGCRNFEVDVLAFRHLTADLPIKIFCAMDDHHSSDGYCVPPIEVLRGVWSNWYRQGTDGIQTFNFKYAPDPGELHWPLHQTAYREMGSPDTIRYLDKTFVIQRRGGGHGPSVLPNPENWSTPRLFYSNTNMLASLPAALENDGEADTLLTLYVGDDLSNAGKKVLDINLRVLLNDLSTEELPPKKKLSPVLVREWMVPKREGGPGPAPYWTSGLLQGIESSIEVRINNSLLKNVQFNRGWLEYDVRVKQLALGSNLLGIRVINRQKKILQKILIEKVELSVRYNPKVS